MRPVCVLTISATVQWEVSMRLSSSSSPSDSVSPASGDRARPGSRKTEISKFYTIEQIADCLDVSTKTVRRWIDKKLLVAHRFGGVVRVSEADFAAFLALRRGA
jgi:excisionase family DNA binding protein